MRKVLCLSLLFVLVAAWTGCGDSTHRLVPSSQLVFIQAAGSLPGAMHQSIELGRLRSPRMARRAVPGLTALSTTIASGTDSVIMMKNDGTGETTLASQGGWFGSVQLSLDGKMAVGVAEDQNGFFQIFVVNMSNLQNLNPVMLTSDAQDHMYPQLSPDNKTVLFMKYDNSAETGYAYTISVSGGTQNKISTPSGVFVNYPSYTPNGKKIVFEEENNDTISIMNLDGTNIKNLTTGNYFDEFPSVSPDGQTIVFSRYGKDVETVGEDIYTMKIDGTSVKQLTSDGTNWDPFFVNNKIAFVSYRDNAGGGEIYSMNVDGTGVKRLTNNSLDEYFIW